MGSSWPIKHRFWHKMPICHPEPADQKYSQSEQKKIWPLCSKGQKSKTLGEENGTINWTKNFLDESKHKKAQFHRSVKYFPQKIWWCGQGYRPYEFMAKLDVKEQKDYPEYLCENNRLTQ